MIKINYLTKTKSNGKELEILFAKAKIDRGNIHFK